MYRHAGTANPEWGGGGRETRRRYDPLRVNGPAAIGSVVDLDVLHTRERAQLIVSTAIMISLCTLSLTVFHSFK